MEKIIDDLLIRRAVRHLKSCDEVISGLIQKHGRCTITPARDNPFHALSSSIISQQVSAHAARAIKARLFQVLGSDRFQPEGILKLSPRALKGAGLSRAKIKYIRGLARAVRSGKLDFAGLARAEEEEVISHLVSFPGIGTWTAEMFLIFGLGRPDVLSVNDAGLKRGLKLAYHLPQIPSAAEMISLGESWRPYRSVASWYIWRVVD